MNLFDVVGGREEIDPTAATRGVGVGQTLGTLGASAGPAAFATTVIDKYKASQEQNAKLAEAQNKARQAGIQRILQEGAMAPEGSQARLASDALAKRLSDDPILAQSVGFTGKDTSSLRGADLTALGFKPTKVTSGGITYESPDAYKTTPSFLAGKQKEMSAAIDTLKNNDFDRSRINDALKAAETITGGLGGKIQRGAMQMFDPNNPQLGEWQKVKSVLTDAQLLKTAKTKGAISDREMELFAKAAANDDIASLPMIKVALGDLLNRLDAIDSAAKESFKANYGEELSVGSTQPASPVSFDADKEARYQAWKAKQLGA